MSRQCHRLVVLYGDNDNGQDTSHLDALDEFNHPRKRQQLILQALKKVQQEHPSIELQAQQSAIATAETFHSVYDKTHSPGLLRFLQTAWHQWEALGVEGRDGSGCQPGTTATSSIPPLIPSNRIRHCHVSIPQTTNLSLANM